MYGIMKNTLNFMKMYLFLDINKYFVNNKEKIKNRINNIRGEEV